MQQFHSFRGNVGIIVGEASVETIYDQYIEHTMGWTAMEYRIESISKGFNESRENDNWLRSPLLICDREVYTETCFFRARSSATTAIGHLHSELYPLAAIGQKIPGKKNAANFS